jgi:hypothetical protein
MDAAPNNRFPKHAGEIMEDFDPIEWGAFARRF